jgi:hypothetical protein
MGRFRDLYNDAIAGGSSRRRAMDTAEKEFCYEQRESLSRELRGQNGRPMTGRDGEKLFAPNHVVSHKTSFYGVPSWYAASCKEAKEAFKAREHKRDLERISRRVEAIERESRVQRLRVAEERHAQIRAKLLAEPDVKYTTSARELFRFREKFGDCATGEYEAMYSFFRDLHLKDYT